MSSPRVRLLVSSPSRKIPMRLNADDRVTSVGPDPVTVKGMVALLRSRL